MKKVKLNSISLTNFRGHKSLSIDFGEVTTISGDNRLGKSTVFDAFIWLLFGKDQFDRKDYEIIPVIDNKRLDRVDSEVEASIDYDGREMVLRRVLHQKWVRRRGTSEEVFDGCETLYYINDVPLKASEYKARVDIMVEETVFKLITNPAAFLSLHWTKQREFLFQMAGTISDYEVLDRMETMKNKYAIFNITNILNSGKKLEEYKKELAAKRKKLRDDLERIQPAINQTQKLMPEERDFDALTQELAAIEKWIADIDKQLSDRSEAIRAKYEVIQAEQKTLNGLKTKQNEVVNAATAKAQQDAFEANKAHIEDKNTIKTLELEARKADEIRDKTAKTLEEYRKNKASKEAEIVKLRAKWNDCNEKEYEAKSGCLVCPVFNTECSDPLATEKHSEAQEKAKVAFFEAKEKELEEINKQGKLVKLDLDYCTDKIAEFEAKLNEETEAVKSIEDKLKRAKASFVEFEEAKPKEIVPAELPEWIALKSQIEAKEAEIKALEEDATVDNTDLTTAKQEANATRDRLKKELEDKTTIAKYKAEIKRLEEEASSIAQQIADVENIEFAIMDFTKTKIEECDRRVNGMFEIVKFQLFDKTNDGNEFEACIPQNKAGVPISVTNTAEKVNAGLDIIRSLSKFYNVSAPIFVDCAESVNRFTETGSQMIFLRVTKEKVLTINNN